jgi:hypothetical protein
MRPWLWLVAAASVGSALVIRLVHRGPYFPGFEVQGAAQGLYLLATRGWWRAIHDVAVTAFTYDQPFPAWQALPGLFPAMVTAVWPWEYWVHVLSVAYAALIVVALGSAFGIGKRDGWIPLLAWGASPLLLSFSLTPYITSLVPHALALWVTGSAWLRRHAFATLLVGTLITLLAWHVYELGQSVFLVFLLAVVWLPKVPFRVRASWLLIGGGHVFRLLTRPSAQIAQYTLDPSVRSPALLDGVRRIGLALLTRDADLPVIAAAALLGAVVFNRRRAFTLSLFLAQVVLVAVVAGRLGGGELRPRRFIAMEFFAVVAVVGLLAEVPAAAFGRRMQQTIVAILLAGNIWQFVNLVQFVRVPFPPPGAPIDYAWTQPFVHSPVDYMVRPPVIDWYLDLRARADAGEPLLLVYNLGCYEENFTNPTAILERLYLHVGHTRFVDSVFVFGSQLCHHSCVPIRPLAEFDETLDRLQAAGRIASVVGYAVRGQSGDTEDFKKERPWMLSELERRFVMHVETPEGAEYTRFRLEARAPPPSEAGSE